jgi:hypothetical protein
METFGMGDYGIVSGCRTGTAGKAGPALLSPRNDAAEARGLWLHWFTLYAFGAAPDTGRGLPGDDARPLVHQVLDAFWYHPTRAEALARGIYADDSDPAGTASRSFTARDHVRGDRGWLAGSLALSTPDAQAACLRQAPEHERTGAPKTD